MTGVCDACWRGENMDWDACLWDENIAVWRLFVSWECGFVAVSWDENMNVWDCTCVTLVCELRMWICVCWWDENVDVWECVTLVCELRTWICDACLWAENVDLCLLVRWKYGCVRMCDACLWAENVDLWRLFVDENVDVLRFVRRKCGCVRMCDACMWAGNVDLWRLFVVENVDVVVFGREWQCSLCQFILKLETTLRYLHTRHYGAPFWLRRDLQTACSPVIDHTYSC